jgi:hypothetical protein
MLINDFVANIDKYRQRTFVPGGNLEADETVIRWYGKGSAFVDAGLPMYLALERKPDNGGEIQNLADVASGIMLHLKVVCVLTWSPGGEGRVSTCGLSSPPTHAPPP